MKVSTDISRPVPNAAGNASFVMLVNTSSPFEPIRQHLSRVGVDYLRDKMVLVNVHAGLLTALKRHARALISPLRP